MDLAFLFSDECSTLREAARLFVMTFAGDERSVLSDEEFDADWRGSDGMGSVLWEGTKVSKEEAREEEGVEAGAAAEAEDEEGVTTDESAADLDGCSRLAQAAVPSLAAAFVL